MTTIYHICSRQDWERAQQSGEYRAQSLTTEGFIHCSQKEQLAGTAARFFAGQQGLVLLVVDRARVTAPVQDDDIGGGHCFPHLYGPLNLDAVTEVRLFTPDADGILPIPE